MGIYIRHIDRHCLCYAPSSIGYQLNLIKNSNPQLKLNIFGRLKVQFLIIRLATPNLKRSNIKYIAHFVHNKPWNRGHYDNSVTEILKAQEHRMPHPQNIIIVYQLATCLKCCQPSLNVSAASAHLD